MDPTRATEWTPPKPEHLVPTKWGWMVSYPDRLAIGRDVDIGAFTYIQAERGVTIEAGVQIGSHVAIYSRSTIDDKTGPVHLGMGCRIGSHSTVMPGITIGARAVVGAHSFVTKDVPPRCLAYGTPARVIRALL